MRKLLTFIIKDSKAKVYSYTMLGNHKLAFCDYMTAGIKNFYISINFFFNWLHHKLKGAGWSEVLLFLSLILFENLRRLKQLLVSALE